MLRVVRCRALVRVWAGLALAAVVGASVRPADGAGAGTTPLRGLVLYEVSTCDCTGGDELWTDSLWTVDLATGRRRHLTPGAGGHDAAWSPDGRSIAYVDDQDFEVWLMKANGGAKRRLTVGEYTVAAAWSPDGRRLAFGGGPDGDDLVVINVDGSGRRVLASMPAGVDDVTWSPNGAAIAFRTYGFGKDAIYLVDPDGRRLRRLVAGSSPTWAPDGSRLAYAHGGDIHSVRVDGSSRRRLTASPGNAHSPAWSPDGSRIAYQVLDEAIWLVSSNGRHQRSLFPGEDPAWSPDGSRLAFAVYEDGIHVRNADGTGVRRFASKTRAADPAWQPRR
jgi:Tol biopolymer transport system component